MKALASLLLSALVFSGTFAFASDTGEYGIHLFFNEREFVDVMTVTKNPEGILEGRMFVPQDFEGPLLDLKIEDLKIEFDLFVPKNASRPNDLIFHYVGQLFDQKKEQMTGFVTIKGSSEFTASFVGFKRKP